MCARLRRGVIDFSNKYKELSKRIEIKIKKQNFHLYDKFSTKLVDIPIVHINSIWRF